MITALRIFLSLLAASAAAPTTQPAETKTPYEPSSHYTVKNMEGWTVHIHNSLLPGGEEAETGAAAIKQLREDMVTVKRWLADEPLKRLLKVGIWLERDSTNGPHGRTPVFHYHPGMDWLVKMDFHPGKHKCVEYSRASALVPAGGPRSRATTLLHELAHAYHDQVLSFDDPEILAAHKRARENKDWPKTDWVVRANHKEFFAGVSTRYHGKKDEREALQQRDPVLWKKLQQVWGTPKSYADSPPTDAKER
mgnify:FL=1